MCELSSYTAPSGPVMDGPSFANFPGLTRVPSVRRQVCSRCMRVARTGPWRAITRTAATCRPPSASPSSSSATGETPSMLGNIVYIIVTAHQIRSRVHRLREGSETLCAPRTTNPLTLPDLLVPPLRPRNAAARDGGMTDGGMSASALRGSKVMSKRPLPGQGEEYTRRDRTGLPPDGVSALWC